MDEKIEEKSRETEDEKQIKRLCEEETKEERKSNNEGEKKLLEEGTETEEKIKAKLIRKERRERI